MTLQGEGPHAGRRALFLRLMGCNLSCSWCDTPFTWESRWWNLRAQTTHLTSRAIWEQLSDRAGPSEGTLLVITGGEPLLQQPREQLDRSAWWQLLEMTESASRPPAGWVPRYAVHIETNGTIAPTRHTLDVAEAIAVSPKLLNAGKHRGHQDPQLDPAWARVVHDHPGVFFKVVVRDAAEVAHVAGWLWQLGVPRDRIWVMPEGVTAAQVQGRWPTIASAAAEHGVNASHRLHLLAWGTKRGH